MDKRRLLHFGIGFWEEVLRLSLALVFLGAGLMKLFYTQELVGALEVIGLTPMYGSALIGLLLPVFEIAVGLSLLLKWKYITGIKVAISLLTVFWIISFYGLATGLEDDCGCFGPAVESQFGWWMMVRNTVLLIAGIALISFQKDSSEISQHREIAT